MRSYVCTSIRTGTSIATSVKLQNFSYICKGKRNSRLML